MADTFIECALRASYALHIAKQVSFLSREEKRPHIWEESVKTHFEKAWLTVDENLVLHDWSVDLWNCGISPLEVQYFFSPYYRWVIWMTVDWLEDIKQRVLHDNRL